jgi:methionyl aminopeptidase
MTVRTAEEREDLIEAGKRLGHVLRKVSEKVAPGVTTQELDTIAETLIRDAGDTPAFKGYTPEGARFPFPAALCVSVNDEVVHGIPSERILRDGDIVSLDLGLIHNGMVVDAAVTVAVGEIDKKTRELMDTTSAALDAAIEAARPGKRIGDISYATGKTFEGTGFSVVKVLGGHGVGRSVHEEPWIGNEGHPGTGPEIIPGMVLALEPIANLGKAGVILDNDGYTYRTRDGSKSAHFEHSILIEKTGTIVLTKSS